MRKRLIPILLVAACTSAEDGPTDSPPATSRQVGGVEYSADTRVMESFPVQLGMSVTARNTSGAAVTLEFPDPCVPRLEAYRDSARSGEPAWSQERAIGCAAVIHVVEIGAGRTHELGAPTVSAYDVLGDSLPDGRYWLSAVLMPNGQRLELPAGAADLAVPRDE